MRFAWAAGVFDGEGSTVCWDVGGRVSQKRIAISVAQSGSPDRPPQLLLRFRESLCGLGALHGPHRDRRSGTLMYRWSASGFEHAQATLALMWSWLGPVKRDQAATAFRDYREQFADRRPRFRRVRRELVPRLPPLVGYEDLAWAAGFFDGEGWSGVRRRITAAGPIAHLACSINQVSVSGPPEVLIRFQRISGRGRVEGPYLGATCRNTYKWVASHADTPHVIALLRPYLCEPKREQADAALATPTGRARRRGEQARFVKFLS